MEERVEKHIYQYVEAELRNYRTYKKLIAEFENEYQGAKSSLGKDITGRFSKNQTGNPTQNEAIKRAANSNRIKRMIDVVTCIEDTMEELPDMDRKLLDLKYFQGWYTDFGIIRELHIGKTKYYDDKRRIIRKMALRMRLL